MTTSPEDESVCMHGVSKYGSLNKFYKGIVGLAMVVLSAKMLCSMGWNHMGGLGSISGTTKGWIWCCTLVIPAPWGKLRQEDQNGTILKKFFFHFVGKRRVSCKYSENSAWVWQHEGHWYVILVEQLEPNSYRNVFLKEHAESN